MSLLRKALFGSFLSPQWETSLVRPSSFALPLMWCVASVCILGSSCGKRHHAYDINRYYTAAEQDSLMTNIITYIYKAPAGIRREDRHNPEHRSLYKKLLPEFEFVYYHIAPDSTHYVYLVRPARNAEGFKRGVAGQYKVDQALNLLEFREIFNTPMLPVDSLRARGKYLWDDLMHYKHVDRYFLNKDYIEFPNESCTYDVELKEWVY